MVFEKEDYTVYCKEKYYKKFDNGHFYNDGKREYYYGYLIHRVNKYAMLYKDGTKIWYTNGKRHREDGPAEEYSDGAKWWYLNGIQHEEEKYKKIINFKKKKSVLNEI